MRQGKAWPDRMVLEDGDYVRERFLGSSNAAAIIGLGAFGQTPYKVWARKLGLEEYEEDPAREKFLSRRKRFEPLIVEMLREEFGGEIVSTNEQYVDREHAFFTAEVDFAYRDPDDGAVCHGEIKTVSPFAFSEAQGWGEPGTEDIPVHYAAQMQFAMGVTGAKSGLMAALVGFDNMLFYPVKRDEEVIADMRAKCAGFWYHNVMGRIEPEPLVVEDLLKMLMVRRGFPVELDREAYLALQSVMGARENKRLAEEQEKEYQFQLLSWLRKAWDAATPGSEPEKAILTLDGKTIASFNKQVSKRLDSKRLKEEDPALWEEFAKVTESRVLRLVKSKQ